MFENGYYNCQKLQFVPQKTFLWKIPQTSLDSNPALEQNPDNVSDPKLPSVEYSYLTGILNSPPQ